MLKALGGLWAAPLNGVHDKDYPNGDKYSGPFVEGKRQGFGIYYAKCGHRYEGEWMNDLRHGKGIQEFKTTKTTKKGKEKLVSAGKYDGAWHNNKKHGKGRFEYGNGDCYSGDWVDNLKHGHASYTFANGDRFDGEFVNDMMEGEGIFFEAATGDQILGSWAKDQLDGKCVKLCADGTKYTVNYRNGELVGTQELEDNDPLLVEKRLNVVVDVTKLGAKASSKAEEEKEKQNTRVTAIITDDML